MLHPAVPKHSWDSSFTDRWKSPGPTGLAAVVVSSVVVAAAVVSSVVVVSTWVLAFSAPTGFVGPHPARRRARPAEARPTLHAICVMADQCVWDVTGTRRVRRRSPERPITRPS